MKERSPVIFWLLLAATISVDAAVFSWVASERYPAPIYAKMAYDALIVSQLCAICIWFAVRSNNMFWLSAFIAAALAAFVAAMFSDDPVNFIDEFKMYLAYYSLVAALLMAVLWLLRGSKYWRRRTKVAYGLQYSLAQLLVVMTVAAVLVMTMRNGPFQGDGKWASIGFACSVILLTVASVVLWSLPWYWLLRLAATLGVAILLATVFCLAADFRPPFAFAFGAHYLIQAVVLSAWLGWGSVLPLNESAAAERELQRATAP